MQLYIQLYNAAVLYNYTTTPNYASVHAAVTNAAKNTDVQNLQNMQNLETYDIWYRMLSYDIILYDIIWTIFNSDAFYEK